MIIAQEFVGRPIASDCDFQMLSAKDPEADLCCSEPEDRPICSLKS